MRSYLEEIRLHDKNQQNTIEKIKLGITDEIEKQVKTQIRYALSRQWNNHPMPWNCRNELDDAIRSEVLKQVEEQVNAQIVEYIPISLRQQAEESKEQLRDINTSLTNSYVAINDNWYHA